MSVVRLKKKQLADVLLISKLLEYHLDLMRFKERLSETFFPATHSPFSATQAFRCTHFLIDEPKSLGERRKYARHPDSEYPDQLYCISDMYKMMPPKQKPQVILRLFFSCVLVINKFAQI